jgi:hypothetical protein
MIRVDAFDPQRPERLGAVRIAPALMRIPSGPVIRFAHRRANRKFPEF